MTSAELKVLAPAVPIELGGKTRHLLFSRSAWAFFEEATGRSFYQTLADPEGANSETVVRGLVYAGLAAYDIREKRAAGVRNPKVSFDIYDVSEWMEGMDTMAILSQVTDAIKRASPKPKEGSTRPPEQSPESPTG